MNGKEDGGGGGRGAKEACRWRVCSFVSPALTGFQRLKVFTSHFLSARTLATPRLTGKGGLGQAGGYSLPCPKNDTAWIQPPIPP